MIKNLFQRYFKDSFFVVSPQIISLVVGLIALPIILVNLPIADYGKFQFILAFQAFLIVLSGPNITAGAKRGIVQGLEGTFLFAFFKRLKFLIVISLFGIFLSFCLYYIYGFIALSWLLIIASLFLVFGYLFQFSCPEFFTAKKQFKELAFWESAILVLNPTATALAAFLSHNILISALAYFGSLSFVGWIGWIYIIKKNNIILAYKEKKIDRECLSFGKKLIPADLVALTEARISHLIIGFFFGSANLAIFSVAHKLRDNLARLIRRVRTLLYADFVKGEKNEIVKVLNSKSKSRTIALAVIALLCLVFCTLVGYLYIKIFLPQNYQNTLPYFLILSLGLPSIILRVLMQTLLEVNLRYKELTVLFILPNLIKIGLIIVFGFLWGIIGICWAIILGDWIIFGFSYLLSQRKDLFLRLINRFSLLKKLSNF